VSLNSSNIIITGEIDLKSSEFKFNNKLSFRNGLIAKQHRLNSLLGIKEADPAPQHELKVLIKSDEDYQIPNPEDHSSLEEEEEDIYDSQEEMTEPPALNESQIKLENAESEADYQEAQSEMEMIEEEEEEEVITSETEEVLESYEQEQDEDEEMETTIDQLEEDYQLDENSGDYVCYVENEVDNIDEEEYVEYGGEISMVEVPQATKRKYTKHTKDSAKPYKCWIKNCGATFAFRTTMKKHMHLQHSIICQKSTCFICGSDFGDYAEFLAHVKIHTRKSQCDICKLTFVNDEKVINHKAKFHKGDDEGRNFQCNVSSLCKLLF
jgi:hypothetical protein